MQFRQKITRYTSMVIRLIVDLLVMTYGIGRKVILPKRGRNGNLLYSIFIFFTALAERVIVFLEAVIGDWVSSAKAWSFGKRYLRLGVLLVTWALCMLASLEWSGPASMKSTEAVTAAEGATAAAEAANVEIAVARPDASTNAIELVPYVNAGAVSRGTSDVLPLTGIKWLPARRQWLLLCTLRI